MSLRESTKKKTDLCYIQLVCYTTISVKGCPRPISAEQYFVKMNQFTLYFKIPKIDTLDALGEAITISFTTILTTNRDNN